MMMNKWLFLLFCVMAWPVLAMDYSTQQQAKFRADYVVSASECDAIVKHEPMDDVAYDSQDSNQWATVPAETAPAALTVDDFQQVDIPLNIPLDGYLESPRSHRHSVLREIDKRHHSKRIYNADLSESWIRPGGVSVDVKRGNVLYNGKELDPIPATSLNSDCWKKESLPSQK